MIEKYSEVDMFRIGRRLIALSPSLSCLKLKRALIDIIDDYAKDARIVQLENEIVEQCGGW